METLRIFLTTEPTMPMRKSIVRTLAVGAIAVAGVAGSAWFAMGDLQPPSPVETTTAATAPGAPALKPSYIVSVRAPTPEEQAQRDALAQVKPVQPVIDLTPKAIDVAAAAAEVTAEVPDGPLATVISNVNVRSGPGSNSTTLTVATTGSQLPVVGTQGGWTQVALPDGGNGWIASRFLSQ